MEIPKSFEAILDILRWVFPKSKAGEDVTSYDPYLDDIREKVRRERSKEKLDNEIQSILESQKKVLGKELFDEISNSAKALHKNEEMVRIKADKDIVGENRKKIQWVEQFMREKNIEKKDKEEIFTCFEQVQVAIDLEERKTELIENNKILKNEKGNSRPTGTVIYFPAQLQAVKKNPHMRDFLDKIKTEMYQNSIAYGYPERVGLDQMIEDIVKDIKNKIKIGAIKCPIKIHGVSIGGMVGSEVAKKLCEVPELRSYIELEVHNTSRSLSKLVSSLSLIPEGILSILIKIGLGQNLETEKNIEYLESVGVETKISATKGDWLMQGDASFIHSERDDVNILRRILRIIHLVNGVEYEDNNRPKNFARAVVDLSTFVGLVAVNVIAVPVMMLIAIDRLSTRRLKNKNNEYAFGDKILEYKEGEPISNIVRFAGRFLLKTVALAPAALSFVFYAVKDMFSTKQNHKHVEPQGATKIPFDDKTHLLTQNSVDIPPPNAGPEPEGLVSVVQYQQNAQAQISENKAKGDLHSRHAHRYADCKGLIEEGWQEKTMVWKRKQESRRNHMQRITKAWEGVTKIMRKGSRKKP